ncbi:MAG TPA: RDD family protein [Trebonia sp.]|nr:RDD family protein [Trebonia sp.]
MEEIVTGEAVILDLPVARFPTRMLAHLIDMVVQLALLVVLALITGFAAEDGALDSASFAAVIVTSIVVALVVYPVALETLTRGRTLGKAALGLRVVADDGGPERFRQALVRGLAGVIECWFLAGVPALITSMLSARGKRLGDIFAGTFVVRARAPRPVAPGYHAGAYSAAGARAGVGVTGMPVAPALQPWAATLDLSGLPDPLAASAASYLSRYWQLDSRIRDQLGWQLATDIASRVTPPPPPGLPPVAYLNAVLAQRRDRELARLWAATPQPPAPYPPSAPYRPAAYPPAASAPPAAYPSAESAPPAAYPSAASAPPAAPPAVYPPAVSTPVVAPSAAYPPSVPSPAVAPSATRPADGPPPPAPWDSAPDSTPFTPPA